MTPDPGTAARPPIARQASAREFLSVVFRRKWLVIGLFLVTTLTVFAVTLGAPTQYRSIGKVLVKRGERDNVMQAYRTIPNWEEQLASEVQFIQSQPVLDRAQTLLDDSSKAGAPAIRLVADGVDAEVVGASNAVLVAYTDRDPKVAQRACDAVMRAYVTQRTETFTLGYPKQFFDTEIAKVNQDLAMWEGRRSNFSRSSGAVSLDDQQRSSIAYQTSLEAKRNEIVSDLAEARANLVLMRELSNGPNLDSPTTGVGNEQVLVELQMKVMNQEARLAQLRERYRDDSPDVVNAQVTLDKLKDMLHGEVNARLRFVETKVSLLEARLQPVESELRRVQAQLTAMPSQAMTLSEMDREIDMLRDRYNQLVKSSDQAKITTASSSPVSIVRLMPAGLGRATNTRDYVRLGLAPAFSLVVGLGLAFFIDGLDNRVRTASDAESAADLPVLASLRERRRDDALDELPAEEASTR